MGYLSSGEVLVGELERHPSPGGTAGELLPGPPHQRAVSGPPWKGSEHQVMSF